MKEGENCNICVDTLTEACNQFGESQPEFCELKEKYMTTDLSQGDVITELTQIMTSDQKQQVVDSLLLNNSSTPDMPAQVNPVIEPLGE